MEIRHKDIKHGDGVIPQREKTGNAVSRSRLNPYSAYKDSGVEWLGEIPAHWELKRLKYAVTLNPAPTEVRNRGESLEISFVPMEAIGEYGGLELTTTKLVGEVYTGYTYFREGDVVVAKITPCFENGKGAVATGLVNEIAFGTTELHVLRIKESIDRQFIFYLSMGDAFRRLGEAEMYGAGGQKRVPDSFVRNLMHPLPSLSEQRAIAAFLDRETAKIDALVAKKERLIELLQEKRTALISHAVSKGLDPDVPLKDSGVEWLDEIPAHWEVKRVSQVSEILRGKFTHRPRNDPALYDGPYPFVQTGDVTRARKEITSYRQTLNERGLGVSKMFPSGTLVMTIAANIGDVAVLDFAACFPDSVVGFVPRSGIERDFLFYVFLAMKPELLREAPVNTQGNLNIERIGSIGSPIPVPNESEQRAIAAFLDRETAQIDALIAKVQEAIDRLKELRTALISAAVTGKIDVREAAA